jgi:teichuronic acid biosynthesis glycosyltransferase TuaC
MLSHMYPSAVNRTAGIFVHEQVRALAALGHDVRVVSPTGWAPPLARRWSAHREVPGVAVVEGVRVLYPRMLVLPRARLGHRNADAMLWAVAGPLRRVHRRWPFDVVHAHMLVPDGWVAARVGAELGVPAVATAHRADVLDVPARGPRSRARVATAVESIDQVCSVSAAIGEAAAALAPPRRPVQVVPNGADTRVFAPRAAAAARARLGLPDDGPIVSYVGKLVPRKGVDTLVEAMGLLARRPAGAPLLVAAGIGEDRPALERRAAELGVAERVRFVGKVDHDEVGWWMAAGDLFVLPSRSEGLPTVICEAMNVGRPVVATAVDGTPEIVRDGRTGVLVPPSDARALADALARVLDEPGLAARMSEEALRVGREEYTWEANARRMTAIYESLVLRPGSSL